MASDGDVVAVGSGNAVEVVDVEGHDFEVAPIRIAGNVDRTIVPHGVETEQYSYQGNQCIAGFDQQPEHEKKEVDGKGDGETQ